MERRIARFGCPVCIGKTTASIPGWTRICELSQAPEQLKSEEMRNEQE